MPVFPYSAEDLNDMSPNSVAQSITAFLTKSYGKVVHLRGKQRNTNL